MFYTHRERSFMSTRPTHPQNGVIAVGDSPAMRKITELVTLVADTSASVLISGESGTGKELVARMLHQRSARRKAPFITVNCAAIPHTLLESELLGYEKGAFTGATSNHAGAFEMAAEGTLFLDEIEMAPATQVKLLRALEERKIRRLGGKREIPLDVRVIAATNRDPLSMLERGELREDFYYRLNVFSMKAGRYRFAHPLLRPGLQ
jgi:transcriptional regulator with PAS, ATPase and Fis domain